MTVRGRRNSDDPSNGSLDPKYTCKRFVIRFAAEFIHSMRSGGWLQKAMNLNYPLNKRIQQVSKT